MGSCAEAASVALDMLAENCAACHNPEFTSDNGELEDVSDIARLVIEGWIVPADAPSSPLYQRIALDEMPPEDVEPRPSAADVDLLADTIDDCLHFDYECINDVIPASVVLDAVEADLTVAAIDDRPFVRYFTLTHLYDAGFCSRHRELFHEGAAKLINALSSQAQAVPLVTLGPEGTILRFDIRDYGWDAPFAVFTDKWEALIASSPYAVELVGAQAATIKSLANTSVPMLLGDAFIDVAAQPGATAGGSSRTGIGYYEFAEIPTNTFNESGVADNLEDRLALEIDTNIAEFAVARAGFTNSGVATQNRIIERHTGPTASASVMWLTYEFSDDSITAQNIFASPLDFEPTAGEAIRSHAGAPATRSMRAPSGRRRSSMAS